LSGKKIPVENHCFSKYANPFEALKIAAIWDSVPSQLAKENKKFKFSLIHDKARSNTYELAIEWLKKAGLLYLVYQLKVAELPLAGYADLSKFKIFSLDTGLLGAMLNISSEIIIKPDSLFTEYNGAFIENYVCSELKRMTEEEIYYWTSDREAEVDFIIHYQDEIVPIEVKSGLSKDLKSLRIFEEKFKSKRIIRISPRIFVKHDSFINIPLYGIMGLKSILEHKNG
jgi:predicted AAA+ superfamily ATPase